MARPDDPVTPPSAPDHERSARDDPAPRADRLAEGPLGADAAPPAGLDAERDAEGDTELDEARQSHGTGRLVRSSGIVGAGTLLSRLTGVARTAAIAIVLGGHALADGYNLANTTPNMIYDLLLGGVFSATLVPVFVDHHVNRDEEGSNAVVSVLVTALVALTVLAMIGAPWIFRLYTWNIDDPAERAANIAIGVPLLRWFLPQILFYGLTALASAMLNARRSYLAPAFAPVLNNVVVLCMLGAFWRLGGTAPTARDVLDDRVLMMLLGAGTTAGIVVMALSLWPALRRAGIRIRPTRHWGHRSVRQVFSLSGWTLAYALANQVCLVVVLALAASVDGLGNVTAYTYAFMFFQLPSGLFAVSLMTTVEPEMARSAAMADADGFRRHFSVGLRLLLVVLVPSAVGTALLAHPIVNVLIGHGAYRDTAELTGTLLALFALGLVGFAVYLYALRSFYALKDTRTPFLVNIVENAINVALAFALVGRWGVEGLVVAYSVAYSVAAVLALIAVKRRIGHYQGREVWFTTVRVVAAAAAMGVVVWGVTQALGTPEGLASLPTLAVGVVVGSGVFGIGVWALRVPEVDEAVTRLRARLGARTTR